MVWESEDEKNMRSNMEDTGNIITEEGERRERDSERVSVIQTGVWVWLTGVSEEERET